MKASELWEKIIVNYWTKWKDTLGWNEEEIPELNVDFIEENGFYDQMTCQVQVQSFITADPSLWGREERYLLNKIPNGTRVLELGCGTGRFGVYLKKEKGCNYVGIDTSQAMVNICRERGLTAFVMDAKDLKFPIDNFDVILVMNTFFTEILDKIDDINFYIENILKFLKENGIIVGSSYYYTSIYKNWEYISQNKEKFRFKMKWRATGEESELTNAFRISIKDFQRIYKKTGLFLLEQVEVLIANGELVKWGFVLGKKENLPVKGGTVYVDWLPVRITWEEGVEIYRTIVDIIGEVDSFTAKCGFKRSFTDKVGMEDTKSRIVDLHRTFIDKIGKLDSKINIYSRYRIFIDKIGTSDSMSRIVSLHRLFIEKIASKDIIRRWLKIIFKYRRGKEHPRQKVTRT